MEDILVKMVNGGIIDDFRDTRGNWKQSVCIDYTLYRTLSGTRWKGLLNRCFKGGKMQSQRPSYIGVENKFKDFNYFTDWSRDQVGYFDSKYELDKDLLVKGNRIYSPETCVFIPSRVNTLLLKNNTVRGKLPVGVTKHKCGKFSAQCNILKSNRYLGLYDTPEEAFEVYKKHKEDYIKEIAEEYKNSIDIRAYNALINYQVEITD